MTGAGDGTGGAQQPAATPLLSSAFANQMRRDIPDGPSGPYRIILQSYRGDAGPPPPPPFRLPPRAILDDDADADDDEVVEGNTAMSSVATLCNSAIGAGVLSLPFAFRQAGKLLPATATAYCLLLPVPGTALHVQTSWYATACYCHCLLPATACACHCPPHSDKLVRYCLLLPSGEPLSFSSSSSRGGEAGGFCPLTR